MALTLFSAVCRTVTLGLLCTTDVCWVVPLDTKAIKKSRSELLQFREDCTTN